MQRGETVSDGTRELAWPRPPVLEASGRAACWCKLCQSCLYENAALCLPGMCPPPHTHTGQGVPPGARRRQPHGQGDQGEPRGRGQRHAQQQRERGPPPERPFHWDREELRLRSAFEACRAGRSWEALGETNGCGQGHARQKSSECGPRAPTNGGDKLRLGGVGGARSGGC